MVTVVLGLCLTSPRHTGPAKQLLAGEAQVTMLGVRVAGWQEGWVPHLPK